MKLTLGSRLKIILALLLVVVLPVFIWAVATQRIELRKRAATSEPPIVCWNRIQFSGTDVTQAGTLAWPDGCRGNPPGSQVACTQMPVPLSATEVYQYQQWINAGRPYIPGCMPAPSPSPQPECYSCNSNTDCAAGLVCGNPPAVSTTPICPSPSGPCYQPPVPMFHTICVKPDGSTKCGTNPTPTPAASCSGQPDGTSCRLNIYQGGIESFGVPGTCRGGACYPNAATPTPNCVPPPPTCNPTEGRPCYAVDLLPGQVFCTPTPTACTQTGQICGGLRGMTCPTGTSCVYSNGSTRARYPDESGTCQFVQAQSGIVCGGFNGQACPSGYQCVYNNGYRRMPYPDATGVCTPTWFPLPCPTGTPTSCSGLPNGTLCTSPSVCPICIGTFCPKIACRPGYPGTCQNNSCIPNPTPTPMPTPPPGCWYRIGACTTSWPERCNYILDCGITPTPTPTYCQTNGASCTLSVCSRAACKAGMICPDYIACKQIPGTCQSNRCVPAVPTPTPTPACVRNTPIVRIDPANQSANPGVQVLYIAGITDTDRGGCGPTQFTLSNKVPDGFNGYLAMNSVTLSPGDSTGISYAVKGPPTNPNASSQTVPISFTATNAGSGLSSTANASFTLLQPTPVTVKFRFKFAGVTGNNANAIKETVKVTFSPRNGASFDLKPDLVLTFAGDGVYEALYTITNPIPPDTDFTLLVKGPKHGALRFCQQTGQTAACKYGQYMRATGLTFDFTGRPLPPGDLNQDNVIDPTDVKIVTDLLAKPSSSRTPADIKLADVNYDGYVDNTDLGLIVQALATKPDE